MYLTVVQNSVVVTVIYLIHLCSPTTVMMTLLHTIIHMYTQSTLYEGLSLTDYYDGDRNVVRTKKRRTK